MPTDNPSAPNSIPPLGRAVWTAIAGLGVTQIIGWGSTYYLLTILGPRIAADLGLSAPLTSSGMSIMMILGAVLGPFAGRMMDLHGARPVMAAGSVVASVGLVVLSRAAGPLSYVLAWVIIGFSASMVLYPAAFTALTQVAPGSSRRTITLLTLPGGLASTVFWPLSGYLLLQHDWRTVCVIYAALNLLICLPLHLTVIPGRGATLALAAAHGEGQPGLPESARPRAFWLLATALALNGMLITGILNQFLVFMTGLGQSTQNAVLFGMLFGFAQVSARVADMVFGAHYNPLKAAVAVNAGFCLALACLLIGSGASPTAGMTFAVLIGMCNGIQTIVRGTLVVALFGVRGYGERLGTVAVAQGLAGAGAPVILSMVLSSFGAQVALLYCMSLAFLALVATTTLFRHATHSMTPNSMD